MKSSQKFHCPSLLAQQASRDLREPVIHTAEQRKYAAADQHIVEMCNDEIRIVQLQVERHRRDHHACEPAEHKDDDEAEHEQERRDVAWSTLPNRRDPAPDLHTCRYRDRHARGGVEAVPEARQPRRKHVMNPQPEREEADREQREHQ